MRSSVYRRPIISIVVVCTGNICRSPLAEGVFHSALKENFRFEVSSAGLHAVVGAPMDLEAALQLTAHGGDPRGLEGKQLTDLHAKSADLLLTMTRAQREELISEFPGAMQRTFTLAEFARHCALEEYFELDFKDTVARAAANRGLVRLSDDDDIQDPINRPSQIHENVGNQIANYVFEIVKLINNAR